MPKELEFKLLDHEKKHKEFEIQNETLDREISELLTFCNVTENQLTTYVSSPEYFTPAQWDTLQHESKKMEESLQQKLACIPNLAKKKKVQQERIVSPHWLFVR